MTTTTEHVRETVLGVLARIAPEVDLTTIDPDVSLRDQVDLDSVDFLNFVIGVDQALGVSVPEADYAKLATLGGCLRYLEARLGAAR